MDVRGRQLVRVEQWKCGHCSYANWATRGRCNVCNRGRAVDAEVVEEWWDKTRIPPGVAATSARTHSVGEAGPVQRKVPGSQAVEGGKGGKATGRVPERFVEHKERPGKGAGGQARRPKAENEGKPSGGKGEGAASRANKDGKTEETQLPPERKFVLPALPRETLAQKLQSEEARAISLREHGAAEKKIQKAEGRKKEVEDQLKEAGGKSYQSLGYQIRREEEYKKKAQAAIGRAEERIRERQLQIHQLQEQIEQEQELQQRHQQRHDVAEQRLAWLAMQKARESMPDAYVERLRAAKGALAAIRGEELAPVREFLAMLVPPPHDFDMAEDDTSSSSDSTAFWMDQEGREERGDMEEYEEAAQAEVRGARERLEALQQQYQEALENALQKKPKAPKRTAGGEETKQEDEGMDEEQIETLGPEQTVDLYRQKLKEERKRVDSIEEAAKKERIPVVQVGRPGPALHGDGAKEDGGSVGGDGQVQRSHDGSQTQGDKEKETGQEIAVRRGHKEGSSAQPLGQAVVQQQLQVRGETRRERKKGWEPEGKEEMEEEMRAVRSRIEGNMETNAEILMQERMQKQQEEELREVAKLAVARKAAEAIAERLRAARGTPY